VELKKRTSENRQQGKKVIFDLPRAITLFCVQHIPAMMGLCWSKKPNLHHTANIPIIDAQTLKETERGFKVLVNDENGRPSKYLPQIPAILSCLRIVGFKHFTVNVPERSKLSTYIEYLMEIPAFQENGGEMLEKLPFNVSVIHYGHVLKIAEEILGTQEFAEGNEEALIPFAAIRPFLQSHVGEPERPKPTIQPLLAVQTTTENTATSATSMEIDITPDPNTENEITLFWAKSNGDLEF